MTLSMTAGSILTAMEIDNALVRINTALSGLRCHRHGQHDAEIETAVHEARQLKLYLAQPVREHSRCTPMLRGTPNGSIDMSFDPPIRHPWHELQGWRLPFFKEVIPLIAYANQT